MEKKKIIMKKSIVIKKENTKLSIAHILKIVISMGCDITVNDFEKYAKDYNDNEEIKVIGNIECINNVVDYFNDLNVNYSVV